MQHRHIISLLQRDYHTIKCAFKNNLKEAEFAPSYTFKCPNDINPKVGDLVVVDTSKGLNMIVVTEVHNDVQLDLDARFDYYWVVQLVDTSKWEERIAREKQAKAMLLEVERRRQHDSILEDVRKAMSGDELIAIESTLKGVVSK